MDQKLFVFSCTGVLICFDQPPVILLIQNRAACRESIQVGNGSFGCCEAAIVDNCDFVVRVNDCGSVGEGGAAPTWPQSAIPADRRSRWLESARGVKGQRLRRPRWFVRDEMRFMELKTKLDPALDDLCDDCTAEFAMFAAETKKMFKAIPRSHHDRFDIELQSKLSESYVVPSSGLMAIGYALEEVSKSGDENYPRRLDHQ